MMSNIRPVGNAGSRGPVEGKGAGLRAGKSPLSHSTHARSAAPKPLVQASSTRSTGNSLPVVAGAWAIGASMGCQP